MPRQWNVAIANGPAPRLGASSAARGRTAVASITSNNAAATHVRIRIVRTWKKVRDITRADRDALVGTAWPPMSAFAERNASFRASVETADSSHRILRDLPRKS